MLMVLVVALGLGALDSLSRRMHDYSARWRVHYKLHSKYGGEGKVAKELFHWKMFEKYRDAAARPFLPLGPDPSEPE